MDWYKLIPKNKTISMQSLAIKTGLCQRDLRKEITKARLEGIPICFNQYGYFMADKKRLNDVMYCLKIMKKRAFTSLKVASKINAWVNAHGGGGYDEQLTIAEILHDSDKQ